MLSTGSGVLHQKNQALTEILLHTDIADARARTYLTNQGYKHDLIRCPPGPDGKDRWVLVFADNQQLLDLEKYGYAFQFDGAASLNKWSATMSSIMVQSPTGVWIPVGHMIVSEECGDTVEAGLLKLREWAPRWRWHYCLIDDSEREKKGLNAALPGIHIFLCTVHTRRTMQRKIGTQPTSIEFLNRAMHRYTEQGCVDDIERAINRASTRAAKNYITKQFKPMWRHRQWALYARQHSTWLLQNTATQAIEGAFHRDLGRHGRSKRHGLQGTVRVVHATIKARYAHSNLSTWKSNNKELITAVRIVPHPVQVPCSGTKAGVEAEEKSSVEEKPW